MTLQPTNRFLAWAGGLLLVALHLDWWRPQRPELYFGWLPEDLVYRLGWMLLAGIYLVFFTYRVWGHDLPEQER